MLNQQRYLSILNLLIIKHILLYYSLNNKSLRMEKEYSQYSLNFLKRKIDKKLDRIYFLLGTQRPIFQFLPKFQQLKLQKLNQTKTRDENIIQIGLDGQSQYLNSKSSLNNSILDNSVINENQRRKKHLKSSIQNLTDRSRASFKDSRKSINLDNKNEKYEKILKQRKQQEQMITKERLYKGQSNRVITTSPKTYEDMRKLIKDKYLNPEKQRKQVNGLDSVRFKLLQKIAKSKN